MRKSVLFNLISRLVVEDLQNPSFKAAEENTKQSRDYCEERSRERFNDINN
jgi:hypothetical protein